MRRRRTRSAWLTGTVHLVASAYIPLIVVSAMSSMKLAMAE